ncbi:glycoside hydrolase [Mycena olivaceomarginata]|nr:glycoside hydrolase [Mycena olivaceomarginata]
MTSLPHYQVGSAMSAWTDPFIAGALNSVNRFNGWGVTTVDSLDTMLLMKLDGEYGRALKLVSEMHFLMPSSEFAPFFETVIRYLGGLLSGYAISKDRVLLARAEELADKLDPVFNEYGGMFPVFGVNTDSCWAPDRSLAEMASLQVEYLYLAKATGEKRYFDRANNVMSMLASADLHKTGGDDAHRVELNLGGSIDSHLSVGARADSAHEYLLKQYLLTAQSNKKSLEMYIRATTHILTTLLYVSPTRHLLYVTDTSTATFTPRGPAHAQDGTPLLLPPPRAPRAGRTHAPTRRPRGAGSWTCTRSAPTWAGRRAGMKRLRGSPRCGRSTSGLRRGSPTRATLLYADQPTGLAPDEVIFKVQGDARYGLKDGKWMEGGGRRWIDEVEAWRVASTGSGTWKGRRLPPGTGRGRDYGGRKTDYPLRPETIESLYIMWRVTKETRWREMGWRIFEAMSGRPARRLVTFSLRRSSTCISMFIDEEPPSL